MAHPTLALLSFLTTTIISFLLFRGVLLQALARHIRRQSYARRDFLRKLSKAPENNVCGKKPSITEEDDWEKVERNAACTVVNEKVVDNEWGGIIGFFHPFCNAGGGGERVLWAAISATQRQWPNAVCVVYTGDSEVLDKPAILRRVKDNFEIQLRPSTVHFLHISTRHYVLSSTWPHFTLLGQSLGSIILAHEALAQLTPDVFIDTMGYAFALAYCKLIFPSIPTGAYVHYPTISSDMLESLDSSAATTGVQSNTGNGMKCLKEKAKRFYWKLFAKLYSRVGRSIDVVMTNSSWTQSHIYSLWMDPNNHSENIRIVFPPVAVTKISKLVTSEESRRANLIYIAQFRKEKNHELIIRAFARLLKNRPNNSSFSSCTERTEGVVQEYPTLTLVGSIRDSDDECRVKHLNNLVKKLNVQAFVHLKCNVTWSEILEILQTASIGVNGMWNEHFGISVVEYQAAGLICVVHDSGGPKEDIVVKFEGKETGFHAKTEEEFAEAFASVLNMLPAERNLMRQRARKNAAKFSEENFTDEWIKACGYLIEMVGGEDGVG